MQQSTIAKNFSRAAKSYNRASSLQREAAKRLAALISKHILPEGPILEIGCGTGHLSEELFDLFPDRDLEITDLSPEMLAECQKRLGPIAHYALLNGEEVDKKGYYALIASSMTFQWFLEFEKSLHRLLEALVEGGYLIFSLPDAKSYPEWISFCRGDSLINPLIDTEKLKALELQQICFVESYPHPLDFFRHIRSLGANSSLTPRQGAPWRLKSLIKEWAKGNNGEFKVTTSVSLVVLQKRSSCFI